LRKSSRSGPGVEQDAVVAPVLPHLGVDASAVVPADVVAAVSAAGWPGRVLPQRRVWDVLVYPVVEFDQTTAAQRLANGDGPEMSLWTLGLWQHWPAETQWQPPVCPVRVVGVVSDAPWRRAVDRVRQLEGLGAGLVVTRRPSQWNLLEADASEVWVCRVRPGASEILVRGRSGPVPTAVHTTHERKVSEQLFAELIRS
jgi:hypothetical protein